MHKPNLIHRAVLAGAIACLVIPIILIEREILIHTHGTIAYPLDDAFINLTLAKNLAFSHVWGITTWSFSAASTSLLYPLIIAVIYLVSGASLLIPLLVNTVAAIWLLIAVQRWLTREEFRPGYQLLVLVALIALTPLPTLVISGTEYSMVLLFSFLFITRRTFVYGILMVASSYLTLPLLLAAAVILAARRETWRATKLVAISILPAYLFGLLSITKHNYFLPTPFFLNWGLHPVSLTAATLLLVLALIYFFYKGPNAEPQPRAQHDPAASRAHHDPHRDPHDNPAARRDPLLILAGASACYLFFNPNAPRPCYLAFLTGCTVVFGATTILRHPRKWTLYPVPAILLLPFLYRSIIGFQKAAADCIDVYTEQYLAAEFVNDFYYDNPVASTDLGAISFCSAGRTRLVDLAGVFDLEVLNRKLIHNWTPASADSLSEQMNANIAVLHDSWSDAAMEPYWYRIATWQTPTDSISFYSIDRRYIQKLQVNMHAFEARLPPGVVVHYFEPLEVQ